MKKSFFKLVLATTLIFGVFISPASKADSSFGVGQSNVEASATAINLEDYTILTLINSVENISSFKEAKKFVLHTAIFYIPNELCKVGTYDLCILDSQVPGNSDPCDDSPLTLPSNDKIYTIISTAKPKSTKKFIRTKGITSVDEDKTGSFTISSVNDLGIIKEIQGEFDIDLKTKKYKAKAPVNLSTSCAQVQKKSKTKVSKKTKVLNSSGSFNTSIQ